MSIDPAFWEIVAMPENNELPLSFRYRAVRDVALEALREAWRARRFTLAELGRIHTRACRRPVAICRLVRHEFF